MPLLSLRDIDAAVDELRHRPEPNPPSHHQSAFQWTFLYGDRPIMETIGALVLHNLFGRFPTGASSPSRTVLCGCPT